MVLSARCGLAALMRLNCIDVIVLGFNSVEGLYPSPPLGVDSADPSQLPKEKNLHGLYSTSKYSPAVAPLHLCMYQEAVITKHP